MVYQTINCCSLIWSYFFYYSKSWNGIFLPLDVENVLAFRYPLAIFTFQKEAKYKHCIKFSTVSWKKNPFANEYITHFNFCHNIKNRVWLCTYFVIVEIYGKYWLNHSIYYMLCLLLSKYKLFTPFLSLFFY